MIQQCRKLLVKSLHRFGRLLAFFKLISETPNLFTRLAVKVFKKLGKAGDQVCLGKQNINRESNPQFLAQLFKPMPYSIRVQFARPRILHRKIRKRDRDNRTIDRLTFAEFTQHFEESAPGLAIRLFVRVLRCVSARSINQHGFIGKPPIAIARATNPTKRLHAQLFR